MLEAIKSKQYSKFIKLDSWVAHRNKLYASIPSYLTRRILVSHFHVGSCLQSASLITLLERVDSCKKQALITNQTFFYTPQSHQDKACSMKILDKKKNSYVSRYKTFQQNKLRALGKWLVRRKFETTECTEHIYFKSILRVNKGYKSWGNWQ